MSDLTQRFAARNRSIDGIDKAPGTQRLVKAERAAIAWLDSVAVDRC